MEDIQNLTEAQIKDLIVKMSNSEEYLELRKYYSEESFFKTLGVSRDEKVHSNFIAWLLNFSSHHELGYYPLKKFLQMLSIVCKNENNSKAQFSETYANDFLLEDYELTDESTVKTEVTTREIAGFDKDGRIDILLQLKFKGSNKILPIIIENKVLSTENDETTKGKGKEKSKQTEKYFEWSKKEYPCGEGDPYRTPILIFLAPDYEKDIKCKCDAFIKVSYQNLVDYVIEPCLMNVSNNQAKSLIENYLRCLSNTTINEILGKKEGRIMAFVGKEKELLEKFHAKNKELFDAVIDLLANDEELPEADRKKMKAARTVVSKKDYTKYSVDGGKALPKGRCVLAIVKAVAEKESVTTYDELLKIFPGTLQGSKGVIIREADINAKDREDGRYYTKEDEVLTLNGEKIAVSVDWGKDNIPAILAVAKEHGVNVTIA